MLITAAGIASPLGLGPADVWEGLHREPPRNAAATIGTRVPRAKARRMSRVAHLLLESVSQCAEQVGGLDKTTGTVFTSAYAELASNLAFQRMIEAGEPDDCSPSVFSNTVGNASLGHACIEMGTQGPSTMLMGSNPLLLTQALLAGHRTDAVVCGAVEEHLDELDASLTAAGMGLPPMRESSVSLRLERANAGDGVRITRLRHASLPYCPYVEPYHEAWDTALADLLDGVVDGADMVFADPAGTGAGQAERRLLPTPVAEGYDRWCGTSLGADLMQKVFLAWLCLTRGTVPASLTGAGPLSAPTRIGVVGVELTGAASAVLLEAPGATRGPDCA